MYDWAITAKLITGKIKDQLKVVYEPDCASLSLQHAILQRIKNQNNRDILNQNSDDNELDIKDDIKIEYNEMDEIKRILQDINLLQYYKIFMDEGCTTIDDMKGLTKQDLKNDFGIAKFPHRKKIVEAFQNYNNYGDGLKLLNPKIDIDVELNDGDKYILIDIGGGTCDFACHKIEGNCVISELFHPSGGNWGSTNINKKFTYYMDEIFGIESHDSFAIKGKQGQAGYLEVLKKFEKAKIDFGSQYCEDDGKHFEIELPTKCVNYLLREWANSYNEMEGTHIKVDALDASDTMSKLKERLKNKILWMYYNADADQIYKTHKLVDINNITVPSVELEEFAKIKHNNNKYYLSLHYNFWFFLFNDIIDPIIKHFDKLLEINELKDLKYVFLVGGFAESKYFQNYIKGYLKVYENIKIVIPNLPGLCVVDGASKFGLYPNFVKIRRMPKHYGVAIVEKISKISNNISQQYIRRNTIKAGDSQERYVKGIFKSIVKKNETVKFNDEPKTFTARKFGTNTTMVLVEVYSSINDNPLTINDCQPLGTLRVPISRNKKYINIELIFTRTILTVYAYQKDNINTKREIKIDYQNINNQKTSSWWWPF